MKHVIIGASAAGLNAAGKLRELCPQDKITVISSDDKIITRSMLHQVISGKRSPESLRFVSPQFFQEHAIEWLPGQSVTAVDTARHEVYLSRSGSISYDTLLLASGALPVVPPIKNLHSAVNCYTLHELTDAIAIAQMAGHGVNAVVIGGGLIGADAAVGLAARGVYVCVIETGKHLLPLQLDQRSAARYEALFKEHGIDILAGVSVQEVLLNENSECRGVKLGTGESLAASLLIVATGMRPNTQWIQDGTIQIECGVVIDEYCRTTAKDVFAAGDVVGKSATWPLAIKQGVTAAYNMAGHPKKLEEQFSQKNFMNFFRVSSVSVGMVEAPDASYQVEIQETADAYKKVIHKNGIVYGALLQGDIGSGDFWTKIIRDRVDIRKVIAESHTDTEPGNFFQMVQEGKFPY